jgi:hypothetical protein
MKCPACGYTDNPAKMSNEAKAIFKELPKYIQDSLKEIYHYLNKRIPKTYGKLNKDWNKLVCIIDGADHDVVRSSLHTYMNNHYYMEGKDFNYLRVMIINGMNTYNVKKEAELLKYGANPPEIKNDKEKKK